MTDGFRYLCRVKLQGQDPSRVRVIKPGSVVPGCREGSQGTHGFTTRVLCPVASPQSLFSLFDLLILLEDGSLI